MSLIRFLRQRKTLLWLFTVNTVFFGAILLVILDRWSSPFRNAQQKTFERWKQKRDTFFAHVEGAESGFRPGMVRGRQMDRVVGIEGESRNEGPSDLQRKQHEEEKRIDEAMRSADTPLDYVPSVPEYSVIDVVPYINESLTQDYLTIPKKDYTYRILILTPVCDVAHLLEGYVRALSRLTYPHALLSVYFGEDSSTDRTFTMARVLARDLVDKYGFNSADAFHLNTSGGVHGSWGEVHDKGSQYERRSHLANARNMLLQIGLKTFDFDYILWVDSDISNLPEDLIEQLLFADADVVVPSCLFRQGRFKKVFDKNSWRETPTSVADQSKLPDDILIVEGYGHSFRIFLSDLKSEGRVVRLDGVGGCALLIKARCHRNGLIFPEEIYNHHIETEGLAKMATDMGLKVRGMPWVEVFHN